MKAIKLQGVLVFTLLLLASWPLREADSAPKRERLLFAISEGVVGLQDSAEILGKYQELGEVISKAIGRPVTLVLARDFANLEQNLKSQHYDLALARPTLYPARAIRDYQYKLVALSGQVAHATFIVKGDSQIKTIKDVQNAKFLMSEETAYITKVALASLREAGVDTKKLSVRYTKSPGAIEFGIDNNMADVGVVVSDSRVARNWEKKGGRIIHRGPDRPFSPIIASPKLDAEEMQKIRNALVNLNTSDEGKKLLQRTGMNRFTAAPEQALLTVLAWLGE